MRLPDILAGMSPESTASRASRRTAATIFRITPLVVVIVGCATAGRARDGINLSSEASDYSPTARLAVAIERPPTSAAQAADGRPADGDHDTTWTVRVDSGTVAAPGQYVPSAPAIMREVRMSALLVRYDDGRVRTGRGGLEAPWTVVARSAEQLVADSLHYGERLPLPGPLRFALPPVPELASPAGTGVVFEITASAVGEPVRMADGTVHPGYVAPRAVRVYACSPFRVDGRVDRRRERALASRYTAVC